MAQQVGRQVPPPIDVQQPPPDPMLRIGFDISPSALIALGYILAVAHEYAKQRGDDTIAVKIHGITNAVADAVQNGQWVSGLGR